MRKKWIEPLLVILITNKSCLEFKAFLDSFSMILIGDWIFQRLCQRLSDGLTMLINEVEILIMRTALIISFVLLSACTSVHSISNSSIIANITSKNTQLIHAEDQATGVLHINEPSLHVMDRLKLQCRDGIIHGIETKLTSRELIFMQIYSLQAIAHCTSN